MGLRGKSIGDASKALLEGKAILVDSEEFSDVTYAIENNRRGMWILVKGKEIAVTDPVGFAKEIFEVWQHMRL